MKTHLEIGDKIRVVTALSDNVYEVLAITEDGKAKTAYRKLDRKIYAGGFVFVAGQRLRHDGTDATCKVEQAD